MGYEAYGNGSIHYATYTDDSAVRESIDILSEIFDAMDCRPDAFRKSSYIDLCVGDRYAGDEETLEVLTRASALIEIKDGEVCYAGEDDDHWRFIWDEDHWKMQTGEIVYRD